MLIATPHPTQPPGVVAQSQSPTKLAALTAPATALLLLAAACAPVSQAGEGSTSTAVTAAAPNQAATPDGLAGLAVVPAGGADISSAIDGPAAYRSHENLLLPIISENGDWLEVVTTCSTEEWVRRSDVEIVTRSTAASPGPGFDLSSAVIVVDPGHGGRDKGAKGPSGSNEKDFNLSISILLRNRLAAPQDIDWETGHVRPGDQYPAVASVWMTRGPEGPEGGDFELGLAYRAEVANGAGADALIAVHNNSSPTETLPAPGSDVFYAVSSPGSDRLASLIHEELMRGLSPFASSWSAGNINGPKARVDPETGDDFYGLLRRSDPSSVIVEGLYISTAEEERLLETSLVQMAYADAVYRGLIRYLTSDESGTPVIEPIPFSGTVGSPSTASCVVPTQP